MIRSKEIYVSSRTRKRLFWIKEVTPELSEVSGTRQLTIDEIAESLLTEIIEQKYPNIKTLEKRLDALEGQLIVELLKDKKLNEDLDHAKRERIKENLGMK